MTRPTRVGLVVLPLVAALSAVAAALAGWAGPEVVTAMACAGAGCAGLLVSAGETVRWPSAVRPERTSAGWHEARLLAETLVAAAADSRARRHLLTRIAAALGHPARSPGPAATGAGRREYEQALAELRRWSG